jgi:enediyne biosynthesis protein E4
MAVGTRRRSLIGAGLLALACGPDDIGLAAIDRTSSSSSDGGEASGTAGAPDRDRDEPSSSEGEDEDEDEGGGGSGDAAPRFVDATAAAGLGGIVQAEQRIEPFCLLDQASTPEPLDFCFAERLTGGVAAGDYDGDGLIDLFFAALDGPGRLMHNEGDGTFAERTIEAGLADSTRSNGVAWADVDEDGDLDLYLATFAAHRHMLYVNRGDGTFVDEAIERGASLASDSLVLGMTPAFGDVDLDGDLDLFVGEWRPDKELGDSVHHIRLLRNLGPEQPGHFADVTEGSGIDLAAIAPLVDAEAGVYAFAPAFVDLDGDRFPDLAIAADFGTTRIYWNDGGTFAFTDGSTVAGVESVRNGMGSAFGDIDGDGRLDWFISAIDTPEFPELGNRLFLGGEDRTFVDATDVYGVRDGDWGWGAALFDPDADGDLDVVMTAGWTMRTFEDDPLVFWRNDGVVPLVERATAVGLVDVGQGRGLVTFDLENDGDDDVLLVHWGGAPLLWRNDGEPPGFLRVKTIGTVGNRQGMGARVEVVPEGGAPTQVRVVGVGAHFLGHGDPMPLFGLGDREGPPVHEVRVTWPASGAVQVLHDVPRNDVLVVEEPLE